MTKAEAPWLATVDEQPPRKRRQGPVPSPITMGATAAPAFDARSHTSNITSTCTSVIISA